MLGDDIYVLMAQCEIMNGWIFEICLFVFGLASLQTKTKIKAEKINNNNKNKAKQKNKSNTS